MTVLSNALSKIRSFSIDLDKTIKKDDLKILGLFAFFFIFLYFYTKVSRSFYSEMEARSWNVWLFEGRISHNTYFLVIACLSGLSVLLSALGLGIKKQDLPQLVYVPYVMIALLFGVISVWHYIPYPLGTDPDKDRLYILSVVMAWTALVSGVTSIWRPALGLNAFILWFLLAQNSFVILDYLPRSHTDWASIAEFGAILAAIIILFNLAEKNTIFRYQGQRPFADLLFLREQAGPRIHGYSPIEIIFFFLLGLHFSNYVWSGLAKLIELEGPIQMWMTDNPLYLYVPYMHIYDRISAAVPAGLEQFYFTLIKNFTPFFLISSMGIQLICLVIIFHRKLLAVTSILLDIFHAFVFLMAGILFYKWMVLNVGISYVFSKERRPIPGSIKILFMIICIFPFLAGPVKLYKLAWYDMFQFNTYDVYAVLDDGQRVVVPSNFFLNKSLHFSSVGLMNTFHQRFLGMGAWGGGSYEIMQQTKTCDKSLLVKIDPELVIREREKFSKYFNQHHAFMIDHYNDRGALPRFNIYPHHSFSDPNDAEELRSIDFNKVVGYEIVGSHGCINPDIENPRTPPYIFKEEKWLIEVSNV
ncbi:MAG: hypothetical protein AAF569_00650 [Pseudomonadota bacterium]